MSQVIIGFGPAQIAGKSSVTALSSSEATLLTVTDITKLRASQFSVYGSLDLGAVTSCRFYYYFSPDNGTTWFPVSLYNTSNGEITQRSIVVDSGTYSTNGHSMFLDDIQVSGATAFKITGKSASGTPILNSLYLVARDN